MGIFDRLQYNFDSSKFGSASTLSSGASNTINLIASNTPALKQWQITDLSTGSPVRTNYFQNPTTSNVQSMLVSTAQIAMNSLACANTNSLFTTLFNNCSGLVICLNSFQTHTDNLSGVVAVTDPSVPSYDTASSVGQMNMMTLAKGGESQSNTVGILGSFTSLFIRDELKSNTIQLSTYSSQLANSISMTTDLSGNTVYTSNLTNGQINSISSYVSSITTQCNTRRTSDWTFYQNSIQLAKDQAFLQQFSNMGGTNSYLINNVIGTNSLKTKLTQS